MKTFLLSSLFLMAACAPVISQNIPRDMKWSERMALSIMERDPDPVYMDFRDEPKWEYTFGTVLKAFDMLWEQTGKQQYLDYIEDYYDFMIEGDGSVKKYSITNFNIDRVQPGRALFNLYEQTGDEKYLKVIETLRYHLEWQPRTKENGFWHKLIYPWQMWLDGAYMGLPFYTEYAVRNNEGSESFDDIALQFMLMEKNMRDDETGLLYHGWDQSRTQRWSDPETGTSPHFWGRAMGWYAMALVDVLEHFPENHDKREEIIAILNRLAEALMQFQDKESGVWYQIVDMGGRDGNYLEASASIMYVYAFAKGANNGWLPEKYRGIAERTFDNFLNEFVEVDENGLVNIHHVCAVAGLGGSPYRDGSYEYYVNEPQQTNDTKAIGPFIKASLELNR